MDQKRGYVHQLATGALAVSLTVLAVGAWAGTPSPTPPPLTKELCEAKKIVSSYCFKLRCGEEVVLSPACLQLLHKINEKIMENHPRR